MRAAITAAIIAGSVLLFLASCAPVKDSRVCQFTGAVELSGAKVADGTVITAVIGGDEYSTQTPTIYGSSCYSLMIEPTEGRSYTDGTEVIFKIDGQTAVQTGVFKRGVTVGLDLTTDAGTLKPSANLWAIIAAGVGLFMCIGLICFLLHLDRVLKRLAPPVVDRASSSKSSTAVIELHLE